MILAEACQHVVEITGVGDPAGATAG